MVVKGYKLIDIKNYEMENRVNLLSYFDTIRVDKLLELVALGNGKCDIETAAVILDNYLQDHNIADALLEIKEMLIGVGSNKSKSIEESNKMDIRKYESLTDLYIFYCMQLISVGLGYNEFWSMTTSELFKVFNSIAIKIENETNRELSNYHTLAAMVGSAVWGKLQKKPPKVEITKKQETETMKDEELAEIEMVAKLKSIAKRYEKGVN